MSEEFRKTAPAPLAPKAFNIPQPFETVLPNGLKVIVFEDNRFPIVSFRLAFRTGDINDPEDSKGLSSALASMLTQGTVNYSSRELAEATERLGASLHASCSSDNTIISASALTLYKSEALKLLTEILLSPSFPENELALYKENTIKGLEFQRSQADFLADEQTSRIVYGLHPYGVVGPKPADIEKISREKLVEFHGQTMVPNNAMLIAVGNINPEDLLNELNTHFAGWEKGEIEQRSFDSPPIRTGRTLTIVDRVGSAQSNIVLSNLAINRTSPDYFPVIVMNQVLGAGASSRLFMNLREEKGYTYGAYSSFDSRRLAGAFESTAEVRTAVTGDSLKEFFYELEKIRHEKVSEAEIQDAKNFLTGVFPIRAETQEGLTNLIVSQKLYGLPDDYLQTYREKISAVTIEEVQRVANEYILPEKIALIIVGDAEEILPQVKDYAENIEIFATDGSPKNIADYEKSSNAPAADVAGNWNLIIDFQGQNLPVGFVIAQDDNNLSGNFESPFGSGKIKEGTVAGNKVKAVILVDFQGQEMEVNLNANIENDNEIKGNLFAQMDGFPDLPFSGVKGN